MPADTLADMIKGFLTHPTLANMKITFSLLAFAGFMRFDEAIHVRACDVEFMPLYG